MNFYFQTDTEETKLSLQTKFIIGVVIICFIWQHFSFDTTILKRVDMEPFSEPIQVNIAQGTPFQHKIPGGVATITPLAEYKIYGRVYAHHFRPSKLHGAAMYPYDVSIGFGPFQHKEVYKAVKVRMAATISYWSASRANWENHLSKYFSGYSDMSHYFTNNHLCPANKNVRRGIKKLKNKDIVYIEGYLIKYEYFDKNGVLQRGVSSTARNEIESGSGNNGYGSCEQIYVTRIVSRHGDFR